MKRTSVGAGLLVSAVVVMSVGLGGCKMGGGMWPLENPPGPREVPYTPDAPAPVSAAPVAPAPVAPAPDAAAPAAAPVTDAAAPAPAEKVTQ